MGHWYNGVLVGEITRIRENPVPVPLYKPQIPQEFAIAVTGRATNCLSHSTGYTRQTAWATARATLDKLPEPQYGLH